MLSHRLVDKGITVVDIVEVVELFLWDVAAEDVPLQAVQSWRLVLCYTRQVMRTANLYEPGYLFQSPRSVFLRRNSEN